MLDLNQRSSDIGSF